MKDRPTQDMPARETEAALKPLPTGRRSTYCFVNTRHRPVRRPRRGEIVIEADEPPTREADVTADSPEAPIQPKPVADPRPATLDPKDTPPLELETDVFSLSAESVHILRMPSAEPCSCASFDELLGDIFTGSDDGRFIVLQSSFGRNSNLIQRLTYDQAVKALMRLAIRRCPFDGTVMDASLDFEPWVPVPDEPPLCCACGWRTPSCPSGFSSRPPRSCCNTPGSPRRAASPPRSTTAPAAPPRCTMCSERGEPSSLDDRPSRTDGFSFKG